MFRKGSEKNFNLLFIAPLLGKSYHSDTYALKIQHIVGALRILRAYSTNDYKVIYLILNPTTTPALCLPCWFIHYTFLKMLNLTQFARYFISLLVLRLSKYDLSDITVRTHQPGDLVCTYLFQRQPI